jgi:phage/plasmid-like protein (TIGR03299 family)
MAANVETMFYVSNEENGRFVPWHGLGTPVNEALTSADAIKMAGLDWDVVQKPICVDGKEVENYLANVRDNDNKVLGIVTERYCIVQNRDAFDFTDNLIGDEVKYETAGSLRGGKCIWLLAKMPTEKVLDDEVTPYLCFSNTHDGTGAIKVCLTPIRVVCNNTLNMALSSAKRSWSTKHVGDISKKMDEARKTLVLAHEYMTEFHKEADILANSTITDVQIDEFLLKLLPTNEDTSKRQLANVEATKEGIMACYYAPDIMKYRNTKYGVINAIADYVDHSNPLRNTQNYRENNWERIMNGHKLFDNAYDLLTVGANA